MDFSVCLSILAKNYELILNGIETTLIIAISGTLIGLLIGLLVGGVKAITLDYNASAFAKIMKKIYDVLSKAYIEVFRGTPMMVQAVFIYYLVYTNIVQWDKMVAAIFVVSINTGAYMAEIIRSGIQSIDKGQIEAGRALGLTNMQTMINIILPQAIKNAFPAIGNELIVNIKDSSVLSIISITELMFVSRSIAGGNYKFTETYFITACVYLCLTLIASFILHLIEKKLRNNNRVTSLPQSDTDPSNMNVIEGEK